VVPEVLAKWASLSENILFPLTTFQHNFRVFIIPDWDILAKSSNFLFPQNYDPYQIGRFILYKNNLLAHNRIRHKACVFLYIFVQIFLLQ
jgi:hypothetical protein